ncbi:MAG: hypothetical protein M0P74_10545 [Syntrophales bacterium]|jgi:hypothetical protein|nr:hypothetical protein [Syntrophales bacterium]
MRLSETMKKVPLLASADITAGVDSDSINMSDYINASFDVVFGPGYTEVGGTGGAVVKLYSGVTVGAKTTALTFNYRYTGGAIGAASADILSDFATSAALTCAAATYTSRMLTIEIDAAEMASGHSWLTLEIGNQAGAGEMVIVAHLTPKYQSAAEVTCLT